MTVISWHCASPMQDKKGGRNVLGALSMKKSSDEYRSEIGEGNLIFAFKNILMLKKKRERKKSLCKTE